MADIARALREEISRLARKETKSMVGTLQKQVRGLRASVRDQRKRIAVLEAEVAKKQDKVGDGRIQPDVPGDEEPDIRISGASIRRHRERLGLSQRQVGLLLSVSNLTVSNWETEKSAPRGENRLAIAELRKLGVREAQERLEKIESA